MTSNIKKEEPGHRYNMLETTPVACFETALVGQGFDIFKKIHFPCISLSWRFGAKVAFFSTVGHKLDLRFSHD